MNDACLCVWAMVNNGVYDFKVLTLHIDYIIEKDAELVIDREMPC